MNSCSIYLQNFSFNNTKQMDSERRTNRFNNFQLLLSMSTGICAGSSFTGPLARSFVKTHLSSIFSSHMTSSKQNLSNLKS